LIFGIFIDRVTKARKKFTIWETKNMPGWIVKKSKRPMNPSGIPPEEMGFLKIEYSPSNFFSTNVF